MSDVNLGQSVDRDLALLNDWIGRVRQDAALTASTS